MMKNAIFSSIVLVFFLLISPIPICAEEPEEYPGHQLDDSGYKRLTAQAEDEDEEFYYPEEFEEEETYRISDPLRPFNIAMFHFNDKLYFWVLKPVAKGWRAVVPDPARTGFKNFFYNITMPIRFVNALLQLKGQKAAAELGRFAFNTGLGVLGFANPAKDFEKLNPQPEDLGQTFGHYGIGHGFYLFLPVLGPSSARDAVGTAGDFFLDPVRYVDPWELRSGMRGMDAVNSTSFRIGDYETLKEAALDPYEAIKNAYIQNRRRSLEQ